jgi:hypothetical protein
VGSARAVNARDTPEPMDAIAGTTGRTNGSVRLASWSGRHGRPGMNVLKVTIRSGGKERGVVRLREGDAAVGFTTSTGRKIEVDLAETSAGGLLLRSHGGPVAVAPDGGTSEVSAAGQGRANPAAR